MASQLDELTATYSQLCDSSAAQLQQIERELAKEEERKVQLMCQGEITAMLNFAKASFKCRTLKTMLLSNCSPGEHLLFKVQPCLNTLPLFSTWFRCVRLGLEENLVVQALQDCCLTPALYIMVSVTIKSGHCATEML